MSDFKPGWYIVSEPDAEGRTTLKYFAERGLVTCECYSTSDGRQIYLWGNRERPAGRKESWKSTYRFVATDPNGHWDNEKVAAKTNKGAGQGKAKALSPCEDLTKHCPACDRKGLLLMPLRYAVARADVNGWAQAPKLAGSFASGGSAVPLPGALAQYTLRTMREGYLYVFNERLGAKGWKGYLVDAKGYLSEFDVHASQPPSLEALDNAPCGRRATSEMARCIPIPDAHLPGKVGNIWMAFCDTPWTPAVLKEHMDKPAVRQANMRVFDGAAWCESKGAATQSHAATLAANHASVAEFKVGGDLFERMMQPISFAWPLGLNAVQQNTSPAFADSLSPFISAVGKVPQLLEAARQAGKDIPVAMVALEDPIGIAMDLNAQIIRRTHAWTNEPLRRWKRESAQAIDALAMAVRHNVVQRTSETRSTVAGIFGTWFPAHSSAVYRGRNPGEKMEYAGYITEEEADRLGTEAWNSDHIELFDNAKKKNYIEVEYPAELSAFEKATIEPLDAAYLSWMKSDLYRNHFIYNFDRRNIDSGVAYVHKVMLVITDATARASVTRFLMDRLGDDPEKPGSVEVRALAANQEEIIKGWAAATKEGAMKKDGVSWADASEKIWGVFNSVLTSDGYKAAMAGGPAPVGGKWMEVAMNAIAKYAFQISGPVVSRLNGFGNGAVGWVAAKLPERRIISLLGALAKTEDPNRRLRLIDLRTEATRKQATRMVASALASISGGNEQQYRSAVRASLDGIQDAQGRRYPYQALMFVDEGEAQRLTQLRGAQLDAHISQSVIVRHEEFDALLQRNVRRVFDLDFKAGVVSNIFTAFSLGRAWDEMKKAKQEEKDVKIVNFAGGVAGLTGGLMELSAGVAKKHPWWVGTHGIRLRALSGQLSTRAGLLGGLGKFLGAAAGFIGGTLNIIDGYQDIGLSRGYGICMIGLGLASIIAAILLFTTFAFVGLIIGLVVAIITLIVGYFKPTKIQKWLDACYFGKHKSKKFEGLQQETEGLKALSEAD